MSAALPASTRSRNSRRRSVRRRTEYEREQTIPRMRFSVRGMNTSNAMPTTPAQPPSILRWNRALAVKAGDLLPVFDFFGVLFAGRQSLEAMAAPLAHAGSDPSRLIWIAAAIAPFVLYDQRFAANAGNPWASARDFVSRFLMFLGIAGALTYAGGWHEQVPRGWLLTWLSCTVLLCVGSRLLLANALRRLDRSGALAQTVAVVGSGSLADRVIPLLQKKARLFGIFDDRHDPACTYKPDASVEGLLARAQHGNPDRVLITLPESAGRRLRSVARRLRPLRLPLELCPPDAGLALPMRGVGHIGDSLMVTLLADRPIKRWDAVFKSIEDAVLSFIVLLLLLPVLACIALAIKLDSPGPIIFKQRRHGFNNREFDIYKFRTMRVAPQTPGEALQQTLRGDLRVTRVGRFLRKWSLDELPQVFNVLEGTMSLVGPRPHAVNMCTEQQLGHQIINSYAHRHRVKPGITGWSQVNGSRGATHTIQQLRRRVKLDLYYIAHWSLWLDLRILLLTSREVLRATNAF